jgi:hypothetical protein
MKLCLNLNVLFWVVYISKKIYENTVKHLAATNIGIDMRIMESYRDKGKVVPVLN